MGPHSTETLEESATNPKLLLVTDLGTLKAFRLEFTLQDTPRLEELETAVLEDAHARVSDIVTDLAGRRAAPTQKSWSATLATIITSNSNLGAASSASLLVTSSASSRAVIIKVAG
jgi:hypothetical protein